MDLPDPIGWQLERKQRENGKEKSRRELVRQRQPSPEVAGGDEGMGKGSRREERDEKGKVEGKKLEMGRGQSFTGAWSKAGGSPHPTTHAVLSHTNQAVHPQLQTHARPPLTSLFSGLPPHVFQPTGLGPSLASGGVGP